MPRWNILVNILLIICISIIGCEKKGIEADFVSFDRAYIPALFATNQGERGASVKNITILKAEWGRFKGKYYEYNPNDSNWKSNMDNIELMLSKADQIINEGGELDIAHENLEGIRNTFMEMRKRNNIEYYIDYLAEFHEPMEGIILTAKEKITDDDITKIQNLLDQSIYIWDKLKVANFDKALFGFTNEKAEILKKSIEMESESLNNLKQALESKDKDLIIKSAQEIKPNFVSIFTSFGNFDDRINEGKDS